MGSPPFPSSPWPQPAPSSAGRRGVGEGRAGEPGSRGAGARRSTALQQCLDTTDRGAPLQASTSSKLLSSRQLWAQLFVYPQPPGHADTMCLSLTPYYRSAVSSGHLRISPLRRRLSPAAWPTGVCGPPSPLSLGLHFRHEGHGSGEPGTLFSGSWLRRSPRVSLS